MADERAFQEKRRWPRFRVTMRAWLRVSRNGIEHAATGTCYDISEGGTRLFLASELHPGEELRMKLALPYGSPIEILGVVRNRNRYEYGVEFVDVNSEERANLLRNCTALALLM
ncbi:MAG: PilZ domain-containing protein [Acidobacteriota bacterium]|nr:PilZ domain-containing protein [Acidobacteriota bacterium]